MQPSPILPLPQSTISLISASEVLLRPSSAVKELVENCLDAGAGRVIVQLAEGGFKSLSVSDDGCGIGKSDLEILCQRYTTSKLREFSDLETVSTFGFRGEALASLAAVSRVSVVTKIAEEEVGWKATYTDGNLASVKPIAANTGTTITALDLFYNVPSRSRSLSAPKEEYAHSVDIMQRFAVHYPSISFTCKKQGEGSADLVTSTSDRLSVIRLLFGSTLANCLVPLQIDSPVLKFQASGLVSNHNYSSKRTTLLLFINNRLVDCPALKKVMQAMYTSLLPKGGHPWLYLSLQIDPTQIDVNVHPTKKEVQFLNEEEIVNQIADKAALLLANSSNSRTYEFVQTKLPQTSNTDPPRSTSIVQSKSDPKNLVRTDHKTRTLDGMFLPLTTVGTQSGAPSTAVDLKTVSQSLCRLTSILELRAEVHASLFPMMQDIVKNFTFVGVAELQKGLSLIQHKTKLLIVDHNRLGEELFYQIGLLRFASFGKIKLQPAADLETMLKLAAEADITITEQGVDVDEVVMQVKEILMSKRLMLAEYFALSINEEAEVETIPMLLSSYTPNLDRLPLFLLHSGVKVDWSSEKECFETFLRHLASFYAPGPLIPKDEDDSSNEPGPEEAARETWQITNVLFPAIKKYLSGNKSMMQNDIIQVADLPDLYKIFERC